MSLTFRNVKKISKRKRKTGTKTKTKKNFRDPFDDNPLKFMVEDEDNHSDFPSLNSVYNIELFGTPLAFKNGYGSDCTRFLKIKTKLHSIVFMNEYRSKSFEEMRWEDYQSNRKGPQIFEEMNYLKCLSKEPVETSKWKTILPPKKSDMEPVTNSVFGKFPALTKPSHTRIEKVERAMPTLEGTLLPKIVEEEPKEEIIKQMSKEVIRRSSKERSILTNVDKSQPNDRNRMKALNPERKEKSIFRTSSEIKLKSSRDEMVMENLQRYFSCAYSNASIPYEFLSQNNNYYLPCTNISLAYKNHSKFSTRNPSILWDTSRTNPFGYHSIFDRLDPVVEKDSLYGKLLGEQNNCRGRKESSDKPTMKYTAENRFSKKYFWNKFSPYSCSEKNATVPRRGRRLDVEKFPKAKSFWMGLDVVE